MMPLYPIHALARAALVCALERAGTAFPLLDRGIAWQEILAGAGLIVAAQRSGGTPAYRCTECQLAEEAEFAIGTPSEGTPIPEEVR